jgi:hypothetical protein
MRCLYGCAQEADEEDRVGDMRPRSRAVAARVSDEIRCCFEKTFGSSRVLDEEEDKLMRISILATILAFVTIIALPAQAQQSTGSSSQQQMHEDADKGIKTRNSGESGYVGEQERPGASSHVRGQPDMKSSQTTTGTGNSTRDSGGKAGGVSVGEQEKKPVTSPATSQPR